MKKIALSTLVIISLLASCKKKSIDLETSEPPKIAETITNVCYERNQNKDSVSLMLDIKGKDFTGKLIYNNFEKDKNTGTLNGIIKGDTLIADYKFMSEGIESVRQLIFLKKGNTLIEGYGDLKDDNGKMVFKDIKKIEFTSKVLLSKTICK